MSVLSLALNLLPSLVLNPHAFFLLKYHYMIRSAEEGRLSQCCTSTLHTKYSTYRASFAFLLSTLSSYIEYLTKQRRRTPYQRSALHTVRLNTYCNVFHRPLHSRGHLSFPKSKKNPLLREKTQENSTSHDHDPTCIIVHPARLSSVSCAGAESECDAGENHYY